MWILFLQEKVFFLVILKMLLLKLQTWFRLSLGKVQVAYVQFSLRLLTSSRRFYHFGNTRRGPRAALLEGATTCWPFIGGGGNVVYVAFHEVGIRNANRVWGEFQGVFPDPLKKENRLQLGPWVGLAWNEVALLSTVIGS